MDLLLTTSLCRLDAMGNEEMQKYDDARVQATNTEVMNAAPTPPVATTISSANVAPAVSQGDAMPPAPVSPVVAAETPIISAGSVTSSASLPAVVGPTATLATAGAVQRLRH